MKKVLSLCMILVLFVALFSCQAPNVYDEEGYYRVVDGSLPDTLPEYPKFGFVTVGKGATSLDQVIERGKNAGYESFFAIRAKKATSVSISNQADEHLAYTVTEMEILDIYVNEGGTFEGYTVGEKIQIVEPYAYQWKDNKPELMVTSLEIHPDGDHTMALSSITSCEIIEPEKEYILFIKDGMVCGADGEKLTCINSEEIIISKDNANTLFYADLIRAIDQSAYEQMKANGYDDVASRKGGTIETRYDYLYYDLLDKYYYKHSNNRAPILVKGDITLDDTFPEFLNAENFVHSLNKNDFWTQMEKYTYHGEKITELVDPMMYDGAYGGGTWAKGEHFSLRQDFTASADWKNADESKYLFFTVPLENLTLPYGIDFDDTLAQVFEKMGINFDWEQYFEIDNEDYTMTLYEKDGRCLTLQNHWLSPLDDPAYHYTLTYQETYEIMSTIVEGRELTVTRTVELHFGSVLEAVKITVNENYEI